ncbi:MAG: glucose 1-dehydrogenase [Deltaproteobacteria bacterium]|nr:glucose 1-dehydrogenase [Deltaproteobacteria bacterium]
MKLEGKVALITGGGGGIGAAVAERFVNEGAKILITGRRQGLLENMAQKLPAGSVEIFAGDVSKEKDAKGMVETAVKFGGKLDVLVNNAGISMIGSVADISIENWNKTLAINLTGPMMMMKEAIPHMIKAGGGSIINIASVGGLRCLPGRTAYCTTKAGLIMLTKQTALDYGKNNIRCNAVCPGGVTTEMTEADFGQAAKMVGMETGPFIKEIATAMPLNRFADIHEMGGICTFLASDDSSFMTGAELVIDGGTAVVDVVGAGISGLMRKAGVL